MLPMLFANIENIWGCVEYLGGIRVHTNSKQIAAMLYKIYISIIKKTCTSYSACNFLN